MIWSSVVKVTVKSLPGWRTLVGTWIPVIIPRVEWAKVRRRKMDANDLRNMVPARFGLEGKR